MFHAPLKGLSETHKRAFCGFTFSIKSNTYMNQAAITTPKPATDPAECFTAPAHMRSVLFDYCSNHTLNIRTMSNATFYAMLFDILRKHMHNR